MDYNSPPNAVETSNAVVSSGGVPAQPSAILTLYGVMEKKWYYKFFDSCCCYSTKKPIQELRKVEIRIFGEVVYHWNYKYKCCPDCYLPINKWFWLKL